MEDLADGTVKLLPSSMATEVGFPPRYEIRSVIGKGGMGMVFHATDLELGRDVAIKLMLFEGARDPEGQERFLREAKALSVLNHPNIVRIFLSGLNAKGDPFHVMEFIEGNSLSGEIAEQRIDASQFFSVFMQVASGLDHAHSAGVLHRDLKPSNIMHCRDIDGEDLYKIIDFGIAKVQNNAEMHSKTLTRTDAILGSPLYMSPEQCRGENGGSSSDIYSMGCMMYECITGSPPFKGDSAFETMYMHMTAQIPALSGKSENSRKLIDLIVQCLAKNPTERPQSAKDFRKRLEEIQNCDHSELDIFSTSLKQKKKNQPLFSTKTFVISSIAVTLIGAAGLVSLVSRPKAQIALSQTDSDKAAREIEKAKTKLARWTNPDTLQERSSMEAYMQDIFNLGRLGMSSSSPADRANALALYKRALAFCASKGDVLKGRMPACIASVAKAELACGNLEASERGFDEALQMALSKKDSGTSLDIYLERVRLDISQHKFGKAFTDLERGSELYREEGNGPFDLTVWDQKIDKFGPNRIAMIGEASEDLIKLKSYALEKADDTERIKMLKLGGDFTRRLGKIKLISGHHRRNSIKFCQALIANISAKDRIPHDLIEEVRMAAEKQEKRGTETN